MSRAAAEPRLPLLGGLAPDSAMPGDIAHDLRNQAVVLTLALDGLPLGEGEFTDEEFRQRIAALCLLAEDILSNAQCLFDRLNRTAVTA